MPRVLFVTPSLDYGGATTQLGLLARGLSRAGDEVLVAVLGCEGQVAFGLRNAGVRVEALGANRRLDLRLPGRLRRLAAAFRPQVTHAWGPQALRTLAVARVSPGPLLASKVLTFTGRLGWLDRWLVRRAARVLVGGAAEAERCRRERIDAAKLVLMPPGVEVLALTEPAPLLPAGAKRFLLCGGPLEARKGFQDAIWAFDIVRRLHPGLSLVLVGSGPDRPRLEQFADAIRVRDAVHFAGEQTDMAAWLARAELVWVPSRTDGGVNMALEAQAAGRPVVASWLAGLREVVADGETGFLVPPGDKQALARQAHRLLTDEALRQQMGAAGRQHVLQHFGAPALVARYLRLCRELQTSGYEILSRPGEQGTNVPRLGGSRDRLQTTSWPSRSH
jgi:glycosyltransferase involved in cell wall biosynthesis